MEPIWGRQDPGGPHVGPMNFDIWVDLQWWRRDMEMPTALLLGLHEENPSATGPFLSHRLAIRILIFCFLLRGVISLGVLLNKQPRGRWNGEIRHHDAHVTPP